MRVDDETLWIGTFGTSGESWEWWHEVTFLSGDWDQPGEVRLVICDPEDESHTVTKTVNMADIRRAYNVASTKYVDACTGNAINDPEDWDACVSDVVLQIAVLGDVVYG